MKQWVSVLVLRVGNKRSYEYKIEIDIACK